VGALRQLQSDSSIYESSNVWIELGPKPLCLGMIKSTIDIAQPSLIATVDQNKDDWETLSSALARLYNAGLDINWNEVHKEYEPNLRLIELPSYAFDLKNYWIQYEGDWSIVKGDYPKTSVPIRQKFSTTSIHGVESETVQDGNATVVFSTNFADPHLRPAVEGHQVNKVGLCPSSLYADMAMSAAIYVHSILFPDKEIPAMEIADMEVSKPFIVDSSQAERYMNLTARKESNSDIIHMTYSSISEGRTVENAHCIVRYGNGKEWMAQWSRQRYLIQDRIARLKKTEEDDSVHIIHRRMVYKLFSVLVTYSERYQGITKAYLDSEAYEAAAHVNFRTAGLKDNFMLSPYWIDSLLHLSGFVINGSDNTSEDAVYISHGWQSLRLPHKLEEDKTYITYVRMQPMETDTVMAGDVYIFDGETIVGLCSGLKFHKIRKSMLNHLLPGNNTASALARKRAIHNSMPVILKQPTNFDIRSISQPSLFDNVIEMIAEVAQVPVADFDDNLEFVEVGIDSLLSTIITTKLREIIGKEIPSSLFMTHPTVAELRSFLNISSPVSSFEDSELAQSSTEQERPSTGFTSTDDLILPDKDNSDLTPALFRRVIAEELGIPESDIQPDTEFTSVGLDSLMSLVILNRLKGISGQAIDPGLFTQNVTFGDIVKLYSMVKSSEPMNVDSPGAMTPISHSLPCTSVLLQGSVKSKTQVFLLPDGSGSAASYTTLPLIGNDIAVFGLNSPYVHSPNGFQESIEAIVSCYISEIQTRQPKGPYTLGGWSVGGVYAYEAARQLVQAGETVAGIILIDSPCPKQLPPMSLETIDLLTRHGMFGKQNTIPPKVMNSSPLMTPC
jgi:naphtho-gamma-pyrone polyketide synthase